MTVEAYSKSKPNPAEIRFVKELTRTPSKCYTSFFCGGFSMLGSFTAELHPTAWNEEPSLQTWECAKAEVTH